jgi:hypothetical protein
MLRASGRADYKGEVARQETKEQSLRLDGEGKGRPNQKQKGDADERGEVGTVVSNRSKTAAQSRVQLRRGARDGFEG